MHLHYPISSIILHCATNLCHSSYWFRSYFLVEINPQLPQIVVHSAVYLHSLQVSISFLDLVYNLSFCLYCLPNWSQFLIEWESRSKPILCCSLHSSFPSSTCPDAWSSSPLCFVVAQIQRFFSCFHQKNITGLYRSPIQLSSASTAWQNHRKTIRHAESWLCLTGNPILPNSQCWLFIRSRNFRR